MTRNAWIIIIIAVAIGIYLDWSTADDGSAAATKVVVGALAGLSTSTSSTPTTLTSHGGFSAKSPSRPVNQYYDDGGGDGDDD